MAIISGGKALRMQAKMPVIVNGDMAISQRSTSETGITAGSNGYHTVDRFRFNEGADPGAAFTMSQETLSSGNAYVNGFNYALKMDCTTADGSLGGDDFIDIEQRIEKQDLVAFKKAKAAFKTICNEKKQLFCEKQLNELINNTNNPKSFWKKLKCLTSKKTLDTTLRVDNMEMHFKTLFKSDSEDLNQVPIDINQDNVDDIEDYIFNSDITDEEIVNSIKALKESKSPGPDDLPP